MPAEVITALLAYGPAGLFALALAHTLDRLDKARKQHAADIVTAKEKCSTELAAANAEWLARFEEQSEARIKELHAATALGTASAATAERMADILERIAAAPSAPITRPRSRS